MTKISLNRIFLLTSVLILTLTLVLFIALTYEGTVSAGDVYDPDSRVMPEVKSPLLPTSVNFAGEQAPLDLFYVRESLDRELLVNTYWHSSTILMLKRANRWFPVIGPILKENGIPDDFKYLALIESGFTGVVSPRGAAGFWQFMEKTAREYGLEVNDDIDERYHVVKATKAACDYFRDCSELYGNWTLVAAAYNAGKRRITESLGEQMADDYYDLYLNEETARYIYRILAIKTIYEDPMAFGFDLAEKDLYPALNTTEVAVTGPIENLPEFAREQGSNYRMLKELNPWLRSRRLPNQSGKTYHIKFLSE